MNKTAIKNFAIWARNKLIADVSYDARLIGITEDGIAKPLPQSFGGTQFFDIGTAEPYSISGEAVRQRDKLIEVIQQKEKDTDYKTASGRRRPTPITPPPTSTSWRRLPIHGLTA